MVVEDSIIWRFYNESRSRSFELCHENDRLIISRVRWSTYSTVFSRFDNFEINIKSSFRQFFMLKSPWILTFYGNCILLKNTYRELTLQFGINTYSIINVEGPLLEVYRNEDKVGEITLIAKFLDSYYALYLSIELHYEEICYISVTVWIYFYCHMDEGGKVPLWRNARKRRYPIFINKSYNNY